MGAKKTVSRRHGESRAQPYLHGLFVFVAGLFFCGVLALAGLAIWQYSKPTGPGHEPGVPKAEPRFPVPPAISDAVRASVDKYGIVVWLLPLILAAIGATFVLVQAIGSIAGYTRAIVAKVTGSTGSALPLRRKRRKVPMAFTDNEILVMLGIRFNKKGHAYALDGTRLWDSTVERRVQQFRAAARALEPWAATDLEEYCRAFLRAVDTDPSETLSRLDDATKKELARLALGKKSLAKLSPRGFWVLRHVVMGDLGKSPYTSGQGKGPYKGPYKDRFGAPEGRGRLLRLRTFVWRNGLWRNFPRLHWGLSSGTFVSRPVLNGTEWPAQNTARLSMRHYLARDRLRVFFRALVPGQERNVRGVELVARSVEQIVFGYGPSSSFTFAEVFPEHTKGWKFPH